MAFDDDYEEKVETQLNMAMPFVGFYIAAASTACALAMAADVINGFRLKKLWFPSNFFSLNAASLAVLAVATKLPVDLNTNMLNPTDAFAKYTSLIFLITTLANFMTSLGSMTDAEIVSNTAALVIFVITIAANVCIQLIELHEFLEHGIYLSIMFSTVFLMLVLTTVVSLAVAAPSIKRSLELKYREKHRASEETEKKLGKLGIEGQREYMMKYLVMAETSSPQFVMARSVVCSSAASTFLFAAVVYAAVILTEAYIILRYPQKNEVGESPYDFSTALILSAQCLAVVVGSIAPAFRWLVGVRFKCGTRSRFKTKANDPVFRWNLTPTRNHFKTEFEIEDYWYRTLVDWRDSFSGLQIKENMFRRYLHNAKWFALTFLIGTQITIVLLSKLLLLLFSVLMAPVFKFVKGLKEPEYEDDDDDDRYLTLRSYVLRLEGEAELPRSVLKNICFQADQLIQKGRKFQPLKLLNLLELKSASFNGLKKIDGDRIPSLHSREPPNCWTLPVVTLTSIAIALPNVGKNRVEHLLRGVSEGLSLAKIVEKTLVTDDELVNIRKAADICWAGVVLYHKWLEINLREMSGCSRTSHILLQKLKRWLKMDVNRAFPEGKSYRDVLENLSIKAQDIVTKFKGEKKDETMKNPLNWPARVVAANSMYRISRTILASERQKEAVTNEGLFNLLSVMIANILAACLANLPRAINTMCHFSAIEKREERVREAFVLVGKTGEIVEDLRKQEWQLLDNDVAESVDEWRALFRQEIGSRTTSASASSDGTRTYSVSQESLGITILR